VAHAIARPTILHPARWPPPPDRLAQALGDHHDAAPAHRVVNVNARHIHRHWHQRPLRARQVRWQLWLALFLSVCIFLASR